MDKSHLGFKEEGDWHDIVAFGEKVYVSSKQSIELMDIPEEEREDLREFLEEFDEWRPKLEEESEEVSNKTAENASVDSPESDEIQENVESASENMKESLEAVEENDPKKAGSHWKETTESLVLASGGTLQRVLEWFEKSIYKNVMPILSPYYFDNDILSASLWKKSDDKYIFELVPNDDQFREVFEKEIEEIDGRGRWHVDTEVDPTDAEIPEGTGDAKDTRTKETIEEQVETMKEENQENNS